MYAHISRDTAVQIVNLPALDPFLHESGSIVRDSHGNALSSSMDKTRLPISFGV
jgi:hypothetical protein